MTEPLTSRSNLAATVLRALFVVFGASGVLALPFVFAPTSWMDAIHQWLGMGPMPHGPIVEYLARSLSAFYTVLGILMLLTAWDLHRFAPMVTAWGLIGIGLGACLIWIDLTFAMPAWWTWGEGPWVIAVGVLILWLQRKAAFQPQ